MWAGHNALSKLSINVGHSDNFQAWSSEPNLMKFTAGKGTESRRKGKKQNTTPDNGERLTLCFCKGINQASAPQRALCEGDQARWGTHLTKLLYRSTSEGSNLSAHGTS